MEEPRITNEHLGMAVLFGSVIIIALVLMWAMALDPERKQKRTSEQKLRRIIKLRQHPNFEEDAY